MPPSSTTVVILAAGQGSRLKSSVPKILQLLAGKPLLSHLLSSCKRLNPKQIIIVIPTGKTPTMQQRYPCKSLTWVEQSSPLGTGHALISALPAVQGQNCLVLLGDAPCISQTLLQQLHSACTLSILTATTAQPHGYGRILRNPSGQIKKIIEEKDCSPEQKQINEVNTGAMLIPTEFIRQNHSHIKPNNQQQEYYLTDFIALWVETQKQPITSINTDEFWQVQGVNTRMDLVKLERNYQRHMANRLINQGVHIVDPERFDCRGEIHAEDNVFIDVNCVFEGEVHLQQGCHIEPNCILIDVKLGANTKVKAFSHLQNTQLDHGASVGPFAYCRAKTHLAENSKIGCFVETKNTHIGKMSKAAHLSYLGDLSIGETVNIGAGVIHCNYNGIKKFQSTIHDGAFIGADSQLIGPVTIGEKATIAAGSTIYKDAPASQLSIARSKQVNIKSWKHPQRQTEHN